jgi:chromosome segregation ATPase
MAAVDPFEALTVAEAAQLAGVNPSQVRARIKAGELLHEVGRRRGREVLLVRRTDLAEFWPQVLPKVPPGAPRADPPRVQWPGPAPSPPPPIEGTTPRREAVETPPEEATPGGQRHALEVRLAAIQAANDGLTHQVRDLQVQRSDLKDQAADLRGRMTLIEKERQAGTAGLLLAQRRLLELEAATPAAVVIGWRRPFTVGVAGVVAVLGLALGWQWRATARAQEKVESTLVDHRRSVDDLLGAARGERELFTRELEGWRDATGDLRAELLDEKAARALDREDLAAALEGATLRAEALAKQLSTEREGAQAARSRFASQLEQTLEQALERGAAARQALVEQQAAAAEDRERFATELDQRGQAAEGREESLQAELSGAGEAIAELRQELKGQRTRDEQRELRLAQQLEHLADLEVELRRILAWRALEGTWRALWGATGK